MFDKLKFCKKSDGTVSLEDSPRTWDELSSKLDNVKVGDKTTVLSKREELLLSMRESYLNNRLIDRVVILLVGTTGAGKSSTINHIFELKGENAIKTNDKTSETTATTEYILEVNSKRLKTSKLRLGLIDTPGVNDTSGLEQDACNAYSLKRFTEDNLHNRTPNLIFITIDANDKRLKGKQSNLAKVIMCLKATNVVNPRCVNIVVILTHCLSLSKHQTTNKQMFTANLEKKIQSIKDVFQDLLNMDVPVVPLENEYENLSKKGDFTELPNGKLQPKNLYKACYEVFEATGDPYGQLIFNEAFAIKNDKVIRLGRKIEATDVFGESFESLSAEESDVSDLLKCYLRSFKKVLDPLTQEAIGFIDERNLSIREKKDIFQIARSLTTKGFTDVSKEANHCISIKGSQLLLGYDLSEPGMSFLKKLGFEDTTYDIGQDSASVIGQGYNILQDRVVTNKIIVCNTIQTKYGVSIPEIAQLNPVNETDVLQYDCRSKSSFIRDRLSHLNVSFNIDRDLFSFADELEVGSTSNDAAASSSFNYEHIFCFERRLFNLTIDNILGKPQMLTKDFRAAVHELPDIFNVEDTIERTKFRRFFEKWGHFMVIKASGGGSFEFRITSSDKDIAQKAPTSHAFRAHEFDFKNSLNELSNDTFFSYGGSVKWIGGDPKFHENETGCNKQLRSRWALSLINRPAMLSKKMDLEPISTMVGLVSPQKRDAARNALEEHLGGKFDLTKRREEEERVKQEQERVKEEREEKFEEATTRDETIRDPSYFQKLKDWMTVERCMEIGLFAIKLLFAR